MDKISIVIPCYNVEDSVERCILSIKNQTYENIEAIFVDDGSTDNTRNAINEAIKDDDRIIYIYKENAGPSAARNFGIEKATGEYICFVDSDDYIERDYVEQLYDNLIANDSDISICYFNRVYEDKTTLNIVKSDYTNIIRHPAPWNKLYKISLFKQNNIRFPVGKWYEDLNAFSKLLLMSSKVSIVEKPLYNYIQNDSSIMHTYDDRIYDSFDVTEDIENFARKHNIFEENFDKLEYINAYHVLVGTMYRASFKEDFSPKTIKCIHDHVRAKYPNWHKNRFIQDLPMFYRTYFKFLHLKCYHLIFIMLKLLNSKINVETL